MIVTVYQNQWMTFVEHDAIRTDPTRMAQGIMTGIGFLGAGVIFKEGLTVRGLTTAASIWVTAAIEGEELYVRAEESSPVFTAPAVNPSCPRNPGAVFFRPLAVGAHDGRKVDRYSAQESVPDVEIGRCLQRSPYGRHHASSANLHP